MTAVWEKTWLFFPRRAVDGKWTFGAGQVWRRWRDGQWEYMQDPETMEDWLDRQW